MKKMSKILKEEWPILIIISLSFMVVAYFYPQLPERVPSHWNFKGEIDGYSSKFFGTFGMCLMNLAIYIILLITPFIDPKKENYQKFESAYRFIKYLLVLFFFVFQIIILMASLGKIVNISMIIQIMISALFILMGNVMGRFKHNYFVGIKTPWTLANKEVWRKTHRMAAPLWVAGGFLNLLLVFLKLNYNGIAFVVILCAVSLIPVIYSYVCYRSISNE